MIVAAQRVANIVKQRADHIFLVAAVAMRAGRGLDGMFQPVDREATIIAIEQAQMVDHALGEPLVEALGMLNDDIPIILGAFQHFAKLRAFAHVVSVGHAFLLIFSGRIHR